MPNVSKQFESNDSQSISADAKLYYGNIIMHCIYVDDMEHILLHTKTQNKQLME